MHRKIENGCSSIESICMYCSLEYAMNDWQKFICIKNGDTLYDKCCIVSLQFSSIKQ